MTTLPTGAVKSAVHRLGRVIVGGRFAPGSVLPVEAALAAELGVGRTVLRETIKVLAGKGLVRTARRYGSRVCPREEWNLLDADVVGWLPLDDPLTRWFMADLVELRRLLEPEAAALAAARATADDVRELERLARALDGPDRQAVLEADVAFHVRLLAASHNRVLAQLGRPLGALLRGYFRIGLEQVGSYWGNPTKHQAIVRAIAARDPHRARAEMLEMLENNRLEAESLVAPATAHA